LACPKVS